MIDIAQVRKDPQAVAARLALRGYALDLDALRALEAERKALQVRAEELQARRNALSKTIGQSKSRGEDASEALAEVAG
ncbi:MAG: serine--tRNA ligase, partial [Burkholderiaceae bacterium]|nr:serine--tRNA ligase [Burkholderiaceae bacterium]